MNAAAVIQAAIPISMTLVVLALGMRCRLDDATYLLREPRLLIRSLLAMNVVYPVVVVAILLATEIDLAVKVALVAMAVAPVPPILPSKELKVAAPEYVYGLLVASAMFSVVLIPAVIWIIGVILGHDTRADPVMVARTVGTSVLAPLAVGMLIRHFWPALAERVATPASSIGFAILVAALIAVLAAGWRAFVGLIGDGTLLICGALTLVGLVIGHLFGGRNEENRSVLALATASRHPGVAIPIGLALYPGHKQVAVAVLLSLLVGTLVSIPYTRWRRKLRDKAVAHQLRVSGDTRR